ncbi:MAG: PilZ domain-containing protein [Gemmataceae bacterium]|nr:PilZ domain-containing protein [Gemmataceae bacterium]
MNLSDLPTRSFQHAHTPTNTTARILVPPSALLADLAHGALLACVSEAELLLESGGAVSAAPAVVTRLDGYQMLGCLGRGPLNEVWQAFTPEGHPCVAYFLHEQAIAGRERDLERLWAITHPTLPCLALARAPSGQFVLLADGYDHTFAGWLRECRSWGLTGAPRAELLGHLGQVAEALDEIAQQHGLAHLGLHPGNLWLRGGRVRVGGFGLVRLLGLDAARQGAVCNPLYAAPELLRGRPGPGCDQYSLAVIYAEMVSGVHPLPASGMRLPRLETVLFSTAEREVLRRALDPVPSARFADCRALVAALAALPGANTPDRPAPPGSLPLLLRPAQLTNGNAPQSLDQFVRALLAAAGGSSVLCERGSIRYHLDPGKGLRHRCAVNLFPGAAGLRLEGFRHELHAEALVINKSRVVFAVHAVPNFWERLTGRHVGLEIEVQLTAPLRTRQRLSEVLIVIRPFGCSGPRAAQLLDDMGPLLLERLRLYLQARPDQRAQERLLWNPPLRVVPVVAGARTGDVIECVGKDISPRGIGLFLPKPLAASHLYVSHPALPQLADVAALARVVRGQRGPDGWYEVGAQFTPEKPAQR